MRQDLSDPVGDHADGDFVFDAAGYDNVGDVALWLDVFVEVGLYVGEPLFHATFDVAAAVLDVTEDWCSELAWNCQ